MAANPHASTESAPSFGVVVDANRFAGSRDGLAQLLESCASSLGIRIRYSDSKLVERLRGGAVTVASGLSREQAKRLATALSDQDVRARLLKMATGATTGAGPAAAAKPIVAAKPVGAQSATSAPPKTVLLAGGQDAQSQPAPRASASAPSALPRSVSAPPATVFQPGVGRSASPGVSETPRQRTADAKIAAAVSSKSQAQSDIRSTAGRRLLDPVSVSRAALDLSSPPEPAPIEAPSDQTSTRFGALRFDHTSRPKQAVPPQTRLGWGDVMPKSGGEDGPEEPASPTGPAAPAPGGSSENAWGQVLGASYKAGGSSIKEAAPPPTKAKRPPVEPPIEPPIEPTGEPPIEPTGGPPVEAERSFGLPASREVSQPREPGLPSGPLPKISLQPFVTEASPSGPAERAETPASSAASSQKSAPLFPFGGPKSDLPGAAIPQALLIPNPRLAAFFGALAPGAGQAYLSDQKSARTAAVLGWLLIPWIQSARTAHGNAQGIVQGEATAFGRPDVKGALRLVIIFWCCVGALAWGSRLSYEALTAPAEPVVSVQGNEEPQVLEGSGETQAPASDGTGRERTDPTVEEPDQASPSLAEEIEARRARARALRYSSQAQRACDQGDYETCVRQAGLARELDPESSEAVRLYHLGTLHLNQAPSVLPEGSGALVVEGSGTPVEVPDPEGATEGSSEPSQPASLPEDTP